MKTLLETNKEPVAWPDAPKEIYLQVCDKPDCDLPFSAHAETTWWGDRIHDTDIRYVRADAAPAEQRQGPVAWQGLTFDEQEMLRLCPHFGPSPARDEWIAGYKAAHGIKEKNT